MKEDRKIPLPIAIAALAGIAIILICGVLGFAVVLNMVRLGGETQPAARQETCEREAVNAEWTGSGNTGTVEILEIPCPGATFFVSGHQGDGFFSVALKTRDGEHQQFVALCSSECEKEEVVNLDPGLYLVEIQSSRGTWVVVVGQ